MEPAKYIMESKEKINACTTLVKTARNIMGRGARKAPANISKIARTKSSPIIFPKRRKVRDMTRALWPINSIGRNRGAKAGTGPKKCLIYLTP